MLGYILILLLMSGVSKQNEFQFMSPQQLFLENLAAVLTQSQCPTIPAGFWNHQLRLNLPCPQFSALKIQQQQLLTFRKSLELGSTTSISLLTVYIEENRSSNLTLEYNNTIQSLTTLQDLFMALGVQNRFINDNIQWLIDDNMRFGGLFKHSVCTPDEKYEDGRTLRKKRDHLMPEYFTKVELVHNFNQIMFDPSRYSTFIQAIGVGGSSQNPPKIPVVNNNDGMLSGYQRDMGQPQFTTTRSETRQTKLSSGTLDSTKASIVINQPSSFKNDSGIYDSDGYQVLSAARDELYKKLINANKLNKRGLDMEGVFFSDNSQLTSQITYQSSASWTICTTNNMGDKYCTSVTLEDLKNNQTKDNLNKFIGKNPDVVVHRVSRSVLSPKSQTPITLNKVRTMTNLNGGIWNIALNSDLKLVNRATEALANNQAKLATIIGKNQDYVLTMQLLNDKNFQELDTKINITMQILTNYTEDLHNYLYKIRQSNLKQMQQNEMVDALIMLHTTSSKLMHFQNELQRYYVEIMAHYMKIVDSIIRKRMYLNLRNTKDVENDLLKIKSKLMKGLKIATGQSLIPFLRDSSATILVSGRQLIYSYDIPLVQSDDEMICYHLTYVPVWVKGKWLSLVTTPTHYLVNLHEKTWYALTEDDYSLCMDNPFLTCPVNHPKWYGGDSICVIGVLLNRTISQDKCLFSTTNIPFNENVVVKSTGICSWLVSPGQDDINFNQGCDPISNPTSDMNTGVINRPTHVLLKRGCSMTSDEFHLECPTVIGQLETDLSPDELTYVNNDFSQNWGVVNEAMSNTKTNYRDIKHTIQYSEPLIPRTHIPFLNHGITNVSRLLHSKVEDFKIMDSYDLIDQLMDDQEVDRSHPWYSSFDFSGLFFYKWLTYINSLVLCAIIAWMIIGIVLARRGGTIKTLVGRGLLLNQLPGSLSFSITKAKSTLASSISTNGNLSAPINHTLDIIDDGDTSDASTFNMLMYMFIGMVLLHLLFELVHWSFVRRNNAVLAAKMGWIPRNLEAVHHEGEVSLCIGIMIEFIPWFKRTRKDTRELVLQLCTLPKSYAEWYCEVRGTNPKLVIQSDVCKFTGSWKFVLEWGQFCIKSKENPLIETCHDLPKIISVDANECIAQLELGHRLSWKSGKGHDIVKMFVLGKSYYRELYNRY